MDSIKIIRLFLAFIIFFKLNKIMNKLLSLSLVAFLIIQILAEYNIPNVYHSPIYGNATLGYFYINLYVGEPEQ